MKNSIFKSYAKKILKSQAFVSVLIVFVLSLGIIGTSYSLYMDVDKDTDYQVVEVGDLAISFDNGSNEITLLNMTPSEDDIAIKRTDNIFSFYIYNTGSNKIDYDINLETIDGNEVDTKYINYQICKDNADNCTIVRTLSDNTLIRKEQLDAKKTNDETNPSAYYFLRIWINNKYPKDQVKSNTIKLKVVVNAKNIKGEISDIRTLSGKILNDDRINVNYDTPDFSKIETEEKGIYLAEDDYGTTYYFRGKQSYNYVNFADKIWRIVRINGDGSVRLVLDDVAKDSDGNKITTAFNTNYNDNAYVGYMYGTSGSTTYEATHENKNDSTIKIAVDKWYEDNLKTNYVNYLSDTLFCGDKTIAESGIGSNNTAKGYGTNKTYYSATERLMYSSGATVITTSTPTFKCAEKANDNYSRYTTTKNTLPNGKETNGNLKYPIGLLTADEVAYAGAYKPGQTNKSYYLYNSSITSIWWLSSPYNYNGSNAYEWYVSGSNGSINSSYVGNTYALRPSINLKASVLINGGDGTSSNPYTLKLS